jgi:hypothetical protein
MEKWRKYARERITKPWTIEKRSKLMLKGL